MACLDFFRRRLGEMNCGTAIVSVLEELMQRESRVWRDAYLFVFSKGSTCPIVKQCE